MITSPLLMASANQHKLEEYRQLLSPWYSVQGLRDYGINDDIPEPYETFEANALSKTAYLFQRSGIACFADDSGLEIDALGGRPGVHSARYAGPGRNITDNITKVLEELNGVTERKARFVAVIAYQVSATETHVFRGIVEGSIGFEPEGTGGFGYDPVFIPSGFDMTFGQLSPLVKNLISHRAKALSSFLDFLKSHRLPGRMSH
jgi:XTP/dITP diphosphohydrolase